MRGLSTTIVVILTLMIGISLVSVGYIFFIGAMEETTEVGEAVVEKTTQLLTTKYKIESLKQGTPGHIYIRNMGSNDVTDISIYINGVLDTTAEIPPLIAPSEVGTINVTAGLSPGDEVKVTGAQGSLVIGTVPGAPPPSGPDTGWGQTTDLSYIGFSPPNLRCMGGQAPNLVNMRIKSLHFKSNNTATASMGVYFGGGEWNPNGAPLSSPIVTQSVSAGWNTFTLPSEVSWPALTVTWVCLNTTGNTHYVNSAPGSTDFYTSHGRHHHWNSEQFPATLGQANFSSYWYEYYLTYYQSST